MGAEAAPNGLSGVSPQKLWAHPAKLSPSAPWLAVARELGVTETVAQQAHRDGGGGREWRTAHAEQRWGRVKYAGVPNHDRPAMLIRKWSAGRRHRRRRWRAGSPAPSRWRSH